MLRIKTLIRRCEARSGGTPGACTLGQASRNAAASLLGQPTSRRDHWLDAWQFQTSCYPATPPTRACPDTAASLPRPAAGRTCGTDVRNLHFLDMPFYSTGDASGCFSQAGCVPTLRLRVVQGCRAASKEWQSPPLHCQGSCCVPRMSRHSPAAAAHPPPQARW